MEVMKLICILLVAAVVLVVLLCALRQLIRWISSPSTPNEGESHPEIITLSSADLYSGKIRELQDKLPKEDPDACEKGIRSAQSLLQEWRRATIQNAHDKDNCRLIIGVDATPATLAGYCVLVQEKRLQYYVIKREDFPWTLHDATDTSEFEMKNFMFALVLWKELIFKYKIFKMFTDNFAISDNHRNEYPYGDRAFKLLKHYMFCKGNNLLNLNSIHVNKFRNLENFAKYIQPADDLSRYKINTGLNFLMGMYGIQSGDITGTHVQKINTHRINQKQQSTAPKKAWYDPTQKYQEVINTVMRGIENHNCTRDTCSDELLRASLRVTHG